MKTRKRPKKEVRIGMFSIGTQQIELWYGEQDGACFSIWPDKGKSVCTVKIGHSLYWWDVLNRVLHESLELVFVQMNLRLQANPEFCNSSGGYVFHATHQQFEEAVARVASFLDDVTTPLKFAWRSRKLAK